jgi:hypothetical protein
MANYTARSAHHSWTHHHAANATFQPGQSRFRPGEGGQKFTDEVIAAAGPPIVQFGGRRLRYEVVNLGRGVIGFDSLGNPTAQGGVVVVATPLEPHYAPDEVITQFPW